MPIGATVALCFVFLVGGFLIGRASMHQPAVTPQGGGGTVEDPTTDPPRAA